MPSPARRPAARRPLRRRISSVRPLPVLIRKVWDNVEEGALCLLLFFMVTITFVTVITRYVFDLPLSYIDQLVPNMFVWVTFLGASAAVKRRAHLGLSMVYDMVPAGVRVVLDALILIGCGVFFLGTAA